ncbi:MAG TPA: hypothetical protein VLC09_02705 [Polyangiaceae bacterium]|nr:hypothetical protein [Polyangiaceae bacterium]
MRFWRERIPTLEVSRHAAVRSLLPILLFASGCAGHSARTLEARQALDARNPAGALALYNEELGVKTGKDVPSDVEGDTALLILDRSMISQVLQDYPSSSRDLELCDKQIEMLDFSRNAVDDIGKYLFSDDTGPYKAPPYEKLLVNTMNMVNYLARHDLGGARVEARRLAIMQKYVREAEGSAVAMLAPGSYLAGFTFERSGKYDEALRYYDEALEYGEFPSLVEPIRRLQRFASYDSERIRKLLAGQPTAGTSAAQPEIAKAAPEPASEGGIAPPMADSPPPAELLIVIQYGRVPAKEAKRIPIGLALTFGAIYLSPGMSSQANALAAQGLVTWINYPELEEVRRPLATPSVRVDGKYQVLEAALDVEGEARKQYERDRGKIVASAITRTVTRVAAGTAAGAGARGATNDDLAGLLVSLGTQAALTAADTPDTRSWATLPSRITVSRIVLEPGAHTVELQAQGEVRKMTVNLEPGGWAAATLTVLR